MKDESSVLLLKQFEAVANHPARPDETVTRLVAAAVPGTDSQRVRPLAPDEISPRVMLRLITYCYAKGVYSSGEIERKLRKSPTHQLMLDAKAIRRFRRLNRVALQSALEKTLQGMHRSSAGEETLIIARREATEKLETAAICDISLEE